MWIEIITTIYNISYGPLPLPLNSRQLHPKHATCQDSLHNTHNHLQAHLLWNANTAKNIRLKCSTLRVVFFRELKRLRKRSLKRSLKRSRNAYGRTYVRTYVYAFLSPAFFPCSLAHARSEKIYLMPSSCRRNGLSKSKSNVYENVYVNVYKNV